jgi:hypothetical protein
VPQKKKKNQRRIWLLCMILYWKVHIATTLSKLIQCGNCGPGRWWWVSGGSWTKTDGRLCCRMGKWGRLCLGSERGRQQYRKSLYFSINFALHLKLH